MRHDLEQQTRVLIAIGICFLVLFVSQAIFGPPQPQRAETPVEQQTLEATVPQADIVAQPRSRDELLAASPRVQIEAPRVRGSINLRGARLDDLVLKDYRVSLQEGAPNIVLLSPSSFTTSFFTQFGWAATENTLILPDENTLWKAAGNRLTPETPVTLSYNNGQGQRFEMVFRIDGNYLITVEQRVINTGSETVTVYPYGLISQSGMKTEFDAVEGRLVHHGPIGYFNGELREFSYEEMQGSSRKSWGVQGGWFGLTDKYWITALIPDQTQPIKLNFTHQPRLSADRYQVDFAGPALTVTPGNSQGLTTHVFAGAKELSLLESYEQQLNIPHFDLAVDFGWFYFLTKPIFIFLNFLFGLVGNFGVAIILLTVMIKIVFLPLANKSYRSMNRMKELQPKVKDLRERYKDDPMRMQQEMMALYKKEKINPASGCLPILVQIPVFFALYKVLYVSIEMRHQPFFGWIQDLSAPDPTSILNLFGLLPYESPAILDFMAIGAWPVIMGVSMFLQQKLNPAPMEKIQQQIFTIMPILFTFLLASFPAGLVIYWTVNNVLSIAQQWIIRRNDPETQRLARKNEKTKARHS